MTSVAFEASTTSFLVKSLKRSSVISIAKIVSLITRHAVLSSLNAGLVVKPSFPKKPTVVSRFFTGRFTKII